ncbi:PREDICTED: odorant receptor 13a-like isoform X2 [Vollenhovia emeryi]|uniref:odorant receptor 13a-like isoform X2 n=1 Tax=Vollenhovia emeryi TaxID=411798 RepID=UPI0005F4489A|nr:PREDICTED: odorant receptor 13a-like isoform X2 [Vollenhovia emeryi]
MDINDYVFINRKVLKFVGLYPTSIVRYIICFMCMITIVIPQGIQIYYNWQDLSAVLETSSVLLTILLAILKSLVWIINRRKMDPFIKYMLTDYWDIMTTCLSKKDADVYAVYVKKGHLYTRKYLFLICNSLMFFFSLPVIEIFITVIKGTNGNSTKHFPFLALYPESYYNFPMYEIIYLSQMVATSLCGLVILGTDTLIATALFHTCGHFKILQEKIKNINTEIDVQHAYFAENIQKIKFHMINVIKHHYTILWFCDYMETVFSPMLFLQTLASSLIICLVGLQIATANITASIISKSVKYISYLGMALFQLLLFCMPGDALIHESSMIYKTVYTIAWYKMPILLKTEIHLLILRSQKPSKITAGKFYVMHLENFNGVLSTAVSYFMLLRSFGSDETTLKL